MAQTPTCLLDGGHYKPPLGDCAIYSETTVDQLDHSRIGGGMTSHAAVVARGMGRPCVAGAGGITVDYAAAKLTVGSVTVTEGQILTIDGSTGEVMVGEVPTVPPQLSGSFGIIMEWADEVRDMKARS